VSGDTEKARRRGTETPRTTGGRGTRERERERERERGREIKRAEHVVREGALEMFGDEVRVWLSYAPGARA